MIFSRSAGITRASQIASLAGFLALSAGGTSWAQTAAAGVDIDPVVLNMYIESRLRKPADQATPEETAAVRNELTDIYLLSVQPRAAELKESPAIVAQIELQTRAMLAQAVATDFVARNQATEAEMRALYADQVTNAAPEYKARHILVETQSEAIALVVELEDGRDFAELATEKSTGPSASTGGDLGWFPPERMVPEFSAAVQALGDGEFTTEPVQTQFGWHVILREGSREATPPPFESVMEVLKQQVEQQKLQDYLASLRG